MSVENPVPESIKFPALTIVDLAAEGEAVTAAYQNLS